MFDKNVWVKIIYVFKPYNLTFNFLNINKGKENGTGSVLQMLDKIMEIPNIDMFIQGVSNILFIFYLEKTQY